MALVVLNWLLFMGMSVHFGGFAVGMRPSVDGFVLENDGRRTPVSPSVWRLSLIYGGVTLMLSPPIAIVLIRTAHQAPLGGRPGVEMGRRLYVSDLPERMGVGCSRRICRVAPRLVKAALNHRAR